MVHRSVQNGDVLSVSPEKIDHGRNQISAVSDEKSAGFDHYLLETVVIVEFVHKLVEKREVFGLVEKVAAAQIDPPELSEFVGKFGLQPGNGFGQLGKILALAVRVQVNSFYFLRKVRVGRNFLPDLVRRNAEFREFAARIVPAVLDEGNPRIDPYPVALLPEPRLETGKLLQGVKRQVLDRA